MASSPLDHDTDLVSFRITVDGKEISSTIEIISISVELDQSGTQIAEVLIRDGYGDHPFEVTQSSAFKLGSNIDIKLGYQSKETSVFKGTIVANTAETGEKKGIELVIDCIGKNSFNVNDGKPSGLLLTYGKDVIDFQLSQYLNDLEGTDTSIEGSVLFQGSSQVEPGLTVDLDGFAKQFNGTHKIQQVHHWVSDGRWTTDISL